MEGIIGLRLDSIARPQVVGGLREQRTGLDPGRLRCLGRISFLLLGRIRCDWWVREVDTMKGV